MSTQIKETQANKQTTRTHKHTNNKTHQKQTTKDMGEYHTSRTNIKCDNKQRGINQTTANTHLLHNSTTQEKADNALFTQKKEK